LELVITPELVPKWMIIHGMRGSLKLAAKCLPDLELVVEIEHNLEMTV
jgi:hypothetical protein